MHNASGRLPMHLHTLSSHPNSHCVCARAGMRVCPCVSKRKAPCPCNTRMAKLPLHCASLWTPVRSRPLHRAGGLRSAHETMQGCAPMPQGFRLLLVVVVQAPQGAWGSSCWPARLRLKPAGEYCRHRSHRAPLRGLHLWTWVSLLLHSHIKHQIKPNQPELLKLNCGCPQAICNFSGTVLRYALEVPNF